MGEGSVKEVRGADSHLFTCSGVEFTFFQTFPSASVGRHRQQSPFWIHTFIGVVLMLKSLQCQSARFCKKIKGPKYFSSSLMTCDRYPTAF